MAATRAYPNHRLIRLAGIHLGGHTPTDMVIARHLYFRFALSHQMAAVAAGFFVGTMPAYVAADQQQQASDSPEDPPEHEHSTNRPQGATAAAASGGAGLLPWIPEASLPPRARQPRPPRVDHGFDLAPLMV